MKLTKEEKTKLFELIHETYWMSKQPPMRTMNMLL